MTSAGRNERFIQLCFVAEDMNSAMIYYSQILGAGPWFISSWWHPDDDPTIYRGKPTPLETQIALAYAGEILIELAVPRPGSQSIFREWADRRGFGLHHYGFGVEDFDRAVAEVRATGADLPFVSMTQRGTRVAMVEEPEGAGALKEFIELTPATRQFYSFLKSEAEKWDGSSLILDGQLPIFSSSPAAQ